MREIKFRAWDKTLNMMHCWKAVEGHFTLEELLDTEYFEALQYTGIRDANRVDIYEGDILGDDGDGWEVKFFDGAFWIVAIDGTAVAELLCGNDYMDVVGNIYENPNS